MTNSEEKCPFRAVGFTKAAAEFPRDELACLMLAAWNNVPVERLTEGMKFFPNESTRDAWRRVADEALQYLGWEFRIESPDRESTGDVRKDAMLADIKLMEETANRFGFIVVRHSEYAKMKIIYREHLLKEEKNGKAS